MANNGGESGRMRRQYKLQICVLRGEMNCNILWESWGEPLPAFMAKYLRLSLEAKGSHKMCANFSSLKNNYQLNYQNFYNCNCTPQKIGLPLAVKAALVIRVTARLRNLQVGGFLAKLLLADKGSFRAAKGSFGVAGDCEK